MTSERIGHIRAELTKLGVNSCGRLWPAVLEELDHAIDGHEFEGKIASYGAIIGGHADPEMYLRPDAEITLGSLERNREAADGRSTFLWRGPEFLTSSVVGFEAARFDSEVAIYTLRDECLRERIKPRASGSGDGGPFRAPIDVDDMIVIQRIDGVVRLLCAKGVVRVRGWTFSLHPYQYGFWLDDYVGDTHQSEHDVEALVLIARGISRFAVHLLSPQRIGATLIWLFSACDETTLRGGNRVDLPVSTSHRDWLNIGAEHPKARTRQWFLASILAQHDGATIIRRDGTATAVNVTIDYVRRECHPPSHGATRQMSAQEGSVVLDAVIVTVSADGPVRAYAGGDLQLSTEPMDAPLFTAPGSLS